MIEKFDITPTFADYRLYSKYTNLVLYTVVSYNEVAYWVQSLGVCTSTKYYKSIQRIYVL